MRPFNLLVTLSLLALVTGCGTTIPTTTEREVTNTSIQRLLGPDETLVEVQSPSRSGPVYLQGRIDGYASPAYAVRSAPGERLVVTMESASQNAYFNVHDSSDSRGSAVFRGEFEGRTATLEASAPTVWLIRPFQPRASARRGERIDFSIRISRNG
ncbi:hypothetical protein MARPU_06295 [Marichromatium purpuratum 984]|uniref:Uncharacterized protein n=1 Tax=Marichromatium purpuratum 984 TaxID=765910 RepID=W0E882_MARPU|nr:hypothetical protein [Marichromatium purpuratum]AHF05439.1 hypothetical protein MARPU_06295 [Marichromatium purpuratum 984]